MHMLKDKLIILIIQVKKSQMQNLINEILQTDFFYHQKKL